MFFETWLSFFVVAWGISLSPGPAAIASLSAGISWGWRRSIFQTMGLVCGIGVQVLIIAVGVGALIAASPLAFNAVRFFGALYLIWIGVSQWRAQAKAVVSAQDASISKEATNFQIFCRGLLINATNPKGTVFFLALLPHFIDPQEPMAVQYLILGATVGFTDSCVMTGNTLIGAALLGYLRSPAHVLVLNRIFGTMFILAGLFVLSFGR